MRNLATFSFGAILLFGCATDPVSIEPRPPVPPVLAEPEEPLAIHLSYPESWNLNDEPTLGIDVNANVVPSELLFSWRSPMGNEISRDSFLFARNVREFEFVYAYVTAVSKDGEFVVRRTNAIPLSYEGPRQMSVLLSRNGDRMTAVAVPLGSAIDENFDGDALLYSFVAIEPWMRDMMRYDDVEWEMGYMSRFMYDEMEFDDEGNPISMSSDDWEAREREMMEQMEREREERLASRVNELHYEWYLDGERFPFDHYEVDLPAGFRGEIRLVVYGENWELVEVVQNPK